MTETKLRSAAEKIPGAESTFEDVLRRAGSCKRRVRTGRRVAAVAAMMMLVCGAVFAGTMEADLSAWATRTDSYSDAEMTADRLGIFIPEKIGDVQFYGITTMYVVPEGTTYLEALHTPVYKWYSADYGISTSDSLNCRVRLSFGNTENDTWKYVFGINDDGSWDTDEEYIHTEEYENTYVMFFGDITGHYSARWVDEEKRTVFIMRVHDADNLEEVIGMVEKIID